MKKKSYFYFLELVSRANIERSALNLPRASCVRSTGSRRNAKEAAIRSHVRLLIRLVCRLQRCVCRANAFSRCMPM